MAACAGSPIETRLAMGRSRNAYKACVAAKGAANCADELAVYQADLAAAQQSPMPQQTSVVIHNCPSTPAMGFAAGVARGMSGC
jgi:hypothetical protein